MENFSVPIILIPTFWTFFAPLFVEELAVTSLNLVFLFLLLLILLNIIIARAAAEAVGIPISAHILSQLSFRQ